MNGRRGKELPRAKAGLTGGKKAGPSRPEAGTAQAPRAAGGPGPRDRREALGGVDRAPAAGWPPCPGCLGLRFGGRPQELASQWQVWGLRVQRGVK